MTRETPITLEGFRTWLPTIIVLIGFVFSFATQRSEIASLKESNKTVTDSVAALVVIVNKHELDLAIIKNDLNRTSFNPEAQKLSFVSPSPVPTPEQHQFNIVQKVKAKEPEPTPEKEEPVKPTDEPEEPKVSPIVQKALDLVKILGI